MSSVTVKIQVPMDKSLRDALAKRADSLGFDSIQAFIRFLAKAQVDGRTVDFDRHEWPEPPAHVADRLNREAQEALTDSKAGKLKAYHTVDELMRALHEQAD